MPSASFHVYFHSQRPQPHEVVNDFAGSWAVVKQSRLKHHLFGVEAESFIGAGIVVVAANRIVMLPRQTHLKIVARHAFVDHVRPRILGRGQPEIAQVLCRSAYPADTVVVQP